MARLRLGTIYGKQQHVRLHAKAPVKITFTAEQVRIVLYALDGLLGDYFEDGREDDAGRTERMMTQIEHAVMRTEHKARSGGVFAPPSRRKAQPTSDQPTSEEGEAIDLEALVKRAEETGKSWAEVLVEGL